MYCAWHLYTWAINFFLTFFYLTMFFILPVPILTLIILICLNLAYVADVSITNLSTTFKDRYLLSLFNNADLAFPSVSIGCIGTGDCFQHRSPSPLYTRLLFLSPIPPHPSLINNYDQIITGGWSLRQVRGAQKTHAGTHRRSRCPQVDSRSENHRTVTGRSQSTPIIDRDDPHRTHEPLEEM